MSKGALCLKIWWTLAKRKEHVNDAAGAEITPADIFFLNKAHSQNGHFMQQRNDKSDFFGAIKNQHHIDKFYQCLTWTRCFHVAKSHHVQGRQYLLVHLRSKGVDQVRVEMFWNENWKWKSNQVGNHLRSSRSIRGEHLRQRRAQRKHTESRLHRQFELFPCVIRTLQVRAPLPQLKRNA